MLASVDTVMAAIGPAIEEAWRQVAPAQPDRACRIAVPIPADVFDLRRGSRAGDLLGAVRTLPMVQSVDLCDRVPDGWYGDGIASPSWPTLLIQGHPYNAMPAGDDDAT